MNKLVHIGFGNVVVASRIIAIIHPDSSQSKGLKTKPRRGDSLLMQLRAEGLEP